MTSAVRIIAAIVLGLALGGLPVVHYWFAAPHAGHGHTHAPAHWTIDLPGVYAPTILLLVLTVAYARRRSAA